MGNLEMEQDLELTLKLNLELESFLKQTYHLSVGTAVAAVVVLEACILLGALSHRRNLLLSKVVVLYGRSSSWLNLWKTDSVD